MTLLQAGTTKVALCVVVFFVASGFANVFPVIVVNPSFEALPVGGLPNNVGQGPYSADVPIPGWTTTGNLQLMGQFQPAPGIFNPGQVPSTTIAYSNDSGSTISQTVKVTVQDGATYILTVDLGHRNDQSFASSADLLVGTTVVATATGTSPNSGDWSTYTAEFTGTAAEVGASITIQLNTSAVQGNFDNVQLTSSVPEPSSLLLLGSGVLVLVQGLRRKLL